MYVAQRKFYSTAFKLNKKSAIISASKQKTILQNPSNRKTHFPSRISNISLSKSANILKTTSLITWYVRVAVFMLASDT